MTHSLRNLDKAATSSLHNPTAHLLVIYSCPWAYSNELCLCALCPSVVFRNRSLSWRCHSASWLFPKTQVLAQPSSLLLPRTSFLEVRHRGELAKFRNSATFSSLYPSRGSRTQQYSSKFTPDGYSKAPEFVSTAREARRGDLRYCLQGSKSANRRVSGAERDSSGFGGGNTLDGDPRNLSYERAETREYCFIARCHPYGEQAHASFRVSKIYVVSKSC